MNCMLGWTGVLELTGEHAVLGGQPDTSVIQTDVKERNAVLAVISPLCNPVSLSRLHTHTDLTESVRQMEERRATQTEAGEWDLYLGDGGRKEHWYLCVDASQRRSLCISMC